MKNIFISIVFFTTIIFSITGCGQKTVAEPSLVKEFKIKKEQATKDNTLVYIIRVNQMMGAAVSLDIGCNDSSYSLTTGSYSLCKFDNDINTVTLSLQQYPGHYKNIDGRTGETIFLYYDFGFGYEELKEIEPNLGMTMVMDAKEKTMAFEEEMDKKTNEYTGKRIPKYDYGHQIALMNPYIVNIDVIKHQDKPAILDDNKSRIIFFRTKDNLLPRIAIWSKSKILGSITNDEYIVTDVEPGTHSFFTKYGAWGILDVNAKAGKTYYVDVDNIWGWSEIYTKLVPTEEIPDLSKFKRVSIDQAKITPLIQKRLNAAIPYIKEISKKKDSYTVFDYSKID